MPHNGGNGRGRGGGDDKTKRMVYQCTATIAEDPSPDPQATWGVQFCLRPSPYHLKSKGRYWLDRAKGADTSQPSISAERKPTDGVECIDLDAPMTPLGSKVWRNIFATCNGGTVRVYEAHKLRRPALLQVFEDADSEESFYCVAWTFNVNNQNSWWVCAAGKRGVLRVIDVQNNRLENSLVGHGEAINDIKTHPRDPALVGTASKDESIRLWNLRTGSTVAVFAGLKGHRGEVVSLDFDRDGDRFASCGIDNSVRIWEISDDDKVVDAIIESHKAADLGVTDTYIYKDETGTRKRATVPIRQFPSFVTRKVHKHYVDCVMWVGDLLLSKSVHNRIYLWQPGADRESLASPATDFTILEEFILDACNVWFIRFALDRSRRIVACGNERVRVASYAPKLPAGYSVKTALTPLDGASN